MSDVLPGQLDVLDLLEGAPTPLTAPRIVCQFCRANWGAGLKPPILEQMTAEHEPTADGRCADMAAKGITEPYYAPGETPWLTGSVIQYPRPKGYGGLYQLRREYG